MLTDLGTGWLAFPSYRLPVTEFRRTFLLGGLSEAAADRPQVQALCQPVGDVIPSHFHDVDQFQVIVAGSGMIGRHRMGRGMLRYVDRHRVYGPVRPDEPGLVYLTLRREQDPGPHYMPDSRDLLASRRPVDPRGLGFDMEALDTCWRDVRYGDPDGLHVRALNLGRSEGVDLQMSARAAGGFVVVLGGTLESASAVEACWLHPGESLHDHAGSSGARVVQLQFPLR